MSLYAIPFRFRSALHVSNVRSDYDHSEQTLHSDTLYAAITHAWAVLGMKEPLAKADTLNYDFTLSSLFPFCTGKDGETIWFFPKPYGRFNDSALSAEQKPGAKALKKVRYIDRAFFEDFLANRPTEAYDKAVFGQYLSRSEMLSDFMKGEVTPRVKLVEREGAEAQELRDTDIYYIEKLFFRAGAGLWALVHIPGDSAVVKKQLLAAVNYLADEGLGTDRHVGHGHFEPIRELTPFQFNLPEPNGYCLTLSLFAPESEVQLSEMLDSQSRFDILQRGGWISTPPHMKLRKRSLYMFSEGSVFKTPSSGFTEQGQGISSAGATHNVTPGILEGKTIITRCGRSLFLPVNLGEQ